jgi:uncharacterized protein CbrC (UPF0167 family)
MILAKVSLTYSLDLSLPMQLQIEHVCSLPTRQTCMICSHLFQPSLARVVVYTEDEAHGDLCPTCLAQGSTFVRTHLEQTLAASQPTQIAA